MSGKPELSHIVHPGRMGDGQRRIEADRGEREALAQRFGLVRIDRLEAEVALTHDGADVLAEGRLVADIVQRCAVSAEDLPVAIDEPLTLRFVPAASYRPDEEIELSDSDCDAIEYSDDRFDLGEAIAQSLALAIDPFAVGPAAEAARQSDYLVGEDDAGPFAALKALKRN